LFVLFICRKEKDPLKPKHPLSAFFLFSNERRAALLAENKNVLEVAKIAGEQWKNMTEKQKRPYEEVYTAHNILFLVGSLFTRYGFLDAFWKLQIAKKNKEKYTQEMEAYKQNKDEEAMNLKKEGEELMKLQKQEALQLLKKKEKTENIIKVRLFICCF